MLRTYVWQVSLHFETSISLIHLEPIYCIRRIKANWLDIIECGWLSVSRWRCSVFSSRWCRLEDRRQLGYRVWSSTSDRKRYDHNVAQYPEHHTISISLKAWSRCPITSFTLRWNFRAFILFLFNSYRFCGKTSGKDGYLLNMHNRRNIFPTFYSICPMK